MALVAADAESRNAMGMHNTFTFAAAQSVGIGHEQLKSARRCCISRPAHGIYTVTKRCSRHAGYLRFADDEELLQMTTRQALGSRSSSLAAVIARAIHVGVAWNLTALHADDVISHESAAMVQDIPTLPLADNRVIVSNPGRSRGLATLRRRKRDVPAEAVTAWGPHRITTPVRTAFDLAADCSVEAGVIALDHLLRADSTTASSPATTSDLLAASVQADDRFSASRRVARAVGCATGLAESPAESLGLVRFADLDLLGDLEQQVVITDDAGTFVARVDFLVRGSVVVEVDGATKYRQQSNGGHAGPGEDPLLQEKRRHYALERLGYRVIRIMWRDLIDPRRFAQRLREGGLLL